MRIYETQDGARLEKVGREKLVQQRADGTQFFILDGIRYNLDDITPADNIHGLKFEAYTVKGGEYISHDGGGLICGTLAGYLIEVKFMGETVQLWRVVSP